ncbi:hypothetical protein ACEZDF_12810 [Vibrio alginolyticus]|uniref:hypothetical protein n=1 Tax=Vibrio alginolyticus TaxID=663 RepID=UPI0035C0B814
MKLQKTTISTLVAALAFSASSLAAGATNTYEVELTKTVESSLSVQLIDDSGTPLPATQNVELLHAENGTNYYLQAKDFINGLKIESNEGADAVFEITRTLSPLSFNGSSDVPGLSSNNMGILQNTNSCTENYKTNAEFSTNNGSVALKTTLQNGGRLCDTSVLFRFGSSLEAGDYASTLTIDVNPSL